MIYILDTDILIFFFRKNPDFIDLVCDLRKKGGFAISVLTLTELRSGWTEQQTEIYLPVLYDFLGTEDAILPISREVAELAGVWRQEYKEKGRQLPIIDSLIAATAVVHNYCLVTNNKKDYPQEELRLYS